MTPRRLALALGLVLGLAVAVSAGAQMTDAQRDSAIAAEFDSIRVAKSRLDSLGRIVIVNDYRARYERRSTLAYVGMFALGVTANAVYPFDRDRGGYRDTFTTGDKWRHFSTASFLTSGAIGAGVPPRWAVATTCAGGAAFEVTQGFVSWRDIVANCAGASLGAGLHVLREKARAARRFP